MRERRGVRSVKKAASPRRDCQQRSAWFRPPLRGLLIGVRRRGERPVDETALGFAPTDADKLLRALQLMIDSACTCARSTWKRTTTFGAATRRRLAVWNKVRWLPGPGNMLDAEYFASLRSEQPRALTRVPLLVAAGDGAAAAQSAGT